VNPSQALLDRLRAVLAPGDLLTAEADMEPYLVDWRRRLKGRAVCVTLPRSTDEVSAVMRACAEHGAPVVPQGGNTGLCGGATPSEVGDAVVLSLKRMNRVRAIDRDNGTITVEAGCVLQQVQEAAEAVDRLFPLSLGAEGSCLIGGNLATNAGGVHVLRYGNTRDLTLGLEVVLPDGRVWDGLRGLRKDNTGYDLKQLFIGAEGTLGVITAAVLKLFPLPKVMTVTWIGLPSAEAAVGLLARMQESFGARLVAFELIADLPLDLVLEHGEGVRSPLSHRYPWYVLMEVSDADGEDELQERVLEVLEAASEAGLVQDAAIAQDVAQARSFWKLRETIPEAQTRAGYSIKHDISVPISRIPEFLAQAGAMLGEFVSGIRIVPFGHLGDGNLHYNMNAPVGMADADFAPLAPAIQRRVHELVHAFDGSISAEHGLGQVKRDEAARLKSEVELDLMRAVKRAIDPEGRMNPGKVV